MLSYQHCFHAGNHADVLKHLCWVEYIAYLNNKTKPYCLIDTHAGDGVYQVSDERNNERDTGIGKLVDLSTDNNLIKHYLTIVESSQKNGVYPGSPALALTLMRGNDQLHLIEKHPAAYANLRQYTKQHSHQGVHVHQRDAFEGLKALTPPDIRRGGILIDPPYEQIEEYKWVQGAIEQVTKRWPQATILLWYPLLGSRAKLKADACHKMLKALENSQTSYCNIQLHVEDEYHFEGMYGSGMFVINPPWTFTESLTEALNSIRPLLGERARVLVTQ